MAHQILYATVSCMVLELIDISKGTYEIRIVRADNVSVYDSTSADIPASIGFAGCRWEHLDVMPFASDDEGYLWRVG